MKIKISSQSLYWKAIFIIIFIVLYFIFLICAYIPVNVDIPIILLIGFALFIVGFFYFFIFISKNENHSFKVKFIQEDTILLILIVLMIITFNIPPVSFSQVVIDWHQISILNLIRAIIFLLGSAFIPGSCLFTIFYPKMTLHKKLKIEPFFLKLILYPVLSFCFLGSISLIFDQLGLLREYFSITLFLIIISLYLLRILFQIRRKTIKSIFKLQQKKISRNTAFIIYMAISIVLIALSIQIFTKYLFGDAIRASPYSNYIGKIDTQPTDKFFTYAVYWNYIYFSLSSLSGIPIMNIGAMMCPFIYLFIFSVYLFMKSFLNEYKEKFSILATILAVSFSSLFYIFQSDFAYDQVSMFVFEGIFNFRYKGFAIILFLLSISLMTTIFKNSSEFNLGNIVRSEEFRIITIAAFFLIQSFMVYFIPIIPAFTYLLIWIILSRNKQHTIGNTLVLCFFIVIFFLIFDIISNFFFSWVGITRLNYFFQLFNFNLTLANPNFMIQLTFIALYTYLLLFSVLATGIIILHIYYKKLRKFHLPNFKIKPSKFLLQVLLIIFSAFFMLEIFLNLIRTIRDLSFFTLFLHNFFYYIGFLGIIAIYLIYFSFKKNREQTYFLFFWFMLSFIIGLGAFLLFLIQNPFSSPLDLPGRVFGNSIYWFDRLWTYSIIPISILACMGIIELRNYFQKNSRFILKKFRGHLIQLLSVSIVIFFSLSNTILAGIMINNHNYKIISNEEAQMSGWVSENLPRRANIIIDGGQLYTFLPYIARVDTYIIDVTMQQAKNDVDIWTTNKNISPNCSVSYNSLNETNYLVEINDANSNGNVSLITYFDSQRSFGIINFSLRISNGSKGFIIDLGTDPNLKAVGIKLEANAIYCYNGSIYQKIMDISNNLWYQTNIIFNAENAYYPNLDVYQWKLNINNTEFGPYFFKNNITTITFLNISTIDLDSDYSIYFREFTFSWNPNYKFAYSLFSYLPIFDYLKKNNLYYLILCDELDLYQERANSYIDIWGILIPELFSTVLYEYGSLSLFKITSI